VVVVVVVVTGFDAVFTRRGTIDLQSVNSGRGGGGEYINEFLLTDQQKDKLKVIIIIIISCFISYISHVADNRSHFGIDSCVA